jgi:hypothetical protein
MSTYPSTSSPRPTLATLLVLGRVSNLPTIWSNCLAGWLLGGGGPVAAWLWLTLGATWLYLGGTFLNDAFDVGFDQQHRRERPIPSGKILLPTVWKLGLSWLVLGLLCLAWFGKATIVIALLLALTIMVYDAIHKIFAFSPVLMAGSRFLLVLLAASISRDGTNGLVVWSALVVASYVAGLSFLARKESINTPVAYWPCILLAGPMVLALVVNRGPFLLQGTALSGALVIWILSCLRYAFWTVQRNVGHAVSGLLAGIVLVDLLALGGGGWAVALTFVGLFALTLAWQQSVPAT